MAEIVTIIGITHNPFMPRLFKQPQQPPGTAKVKERIAMMRQKLAEAKPDVLICIGNDHLHQFFMDNMPAFMIGKMGVASARTNNDRRASRFLRRRPVARHRQLGRHRQAVGPAHGQGVWPAPRAQGRGHGALHGIRVSGAAAGL